MFTVMDKNELMDTNGGIAPAVGVGLLVLLLLGTMASCVNSCDQ